MEERSSPMASVPDFAPDSGAAAGKAKGGNETGAHIEGGADSGVSEKHRNPDKKGDSRKRNRNRNRKTKNAKAGQKNADRPKQSQHHDNKQAHAAAGKYQGRKGLAADMARRNNSGQQRRAYGAIDLGTNNCRLLIAKPAGDSFVVVDAFSRVVRLGEGLGNTGRLSQRAMDRAVAALSVCSDKLKRRNVCLARSVATEACRRADNGAEFIARVERETGIMLDIITAEEEARLAVLGCHILLEPGQGPALIFDIGGGSTELVLIDTDGRAPTIRDWVSVPWGVVSLTEGVPIDISSKESRIAGYETMRQKAADSFREFADKLPHDDGDSYRMLGTSGTVTTLASLHLKLPCYNRNAIDGLIVPSESMRQISQDLGAMAPAERAGIPCIGKDRAELVIAGCAILEAILDIWPSERLGIADRGIREGILRSLMPQTARAAPKKHRDTRGSESKISVSNKAGSGKSGSSTKKRTGRNTKSNTQMQH